MDDSETINVVSRAPSAVRIQEPLPPEYRDRPGEAPPLRSVVINGVNHDERRNGEGVTRGVHAGIFRAWFEAYKRSNHPLAGLIREVSSDELDRDAASENGFEPGIERIGDVDAVSTIQHPAPLSSSEMAAGSGTPNDDAPHGDPDVVPTSHADAPATASVTDHRE